MRVSSFLRLFLVTAALTGYSLWANGAGKARRGGERSAPAGGIPLVHRAEVETLWREPGTLFVDVRGAADFEYGHVEGAVHLSYPEFAGRLEELRPRLERARTLVVYCSSTSCAKSLWAAIELRNAGLGKVVIYPEGWNEWSEAGLPAVRKNGW